MIARLAYINGIFTLYHVKYIKFNVQLRKYEHSEQARVKSSQVNTLPKAKSKTRSKQNKDMQKCSSVYSEREVPLPILTSGGE
jgi:hypothetical protein